MVQITSPSQMAKIKEQCQAALARQKVRFLVCAGTGCVAGGSLDVYNEFKRLIEEKGISVDVELLYEGEESEAGIGIGGCHGFCQMGPLVRVEPKETFYTKVKVADVEEIVTATLDQDSVVERLLYQNPDGSRSVTEHDVPFYKTQQRIVLGKCGTINPEDIREYFAAEGYQALARILDDMSQEQVIDVVTQSGLRGRGGAGFPAGRKWQGCLQAKGSPKYIVCNGDEGDPGAFMDRSVLEGDPFAVIEGMTIAGYSVGANYGYIYVRAEYPLAVKRLLKAIEQAKKYQLLGDNIMGTGFNFDLKIFQGAGAFVCGESTALTLSIEGKRGMPRVAPRPRTTEIGLWDKPTILNNVKSFAYVPDIIRKGADWFKNIGTESSSGTAVFALTGNITNSGLIEVPMGTTFREIIFELGGGIPDGHKFKAVQTGGPSGGCLPESLLDLPIDFDSLDEAGAIMGSGGMVIMDERTCLVDVARYFLDFTVDESCGQCVPCRLGTKQLLEILEDICAGKGRKEDLDLLYELSHAVHAASICGLGQTAANPVLTTLRYFKEEYEAHIFDKRCPAKVCKALISYVISEDRCKGCGICAKHCPVNAITGEKKQVHVIDQSLCIQCGVCMEKCPKKFRSVDCVSPRITTAVPETMETT
ncbi:MAG TPA: NADH-quinone oxidoreductase subunit NuoF [Desulfotignum sp.]|nr:NADH-quinone oxidoreductase subunit NuoF [Desulfotignum sp.]